MKLKDNGVKSDGARFLKKKSFGPFLGQKGLNWARNEVFETLKKIESLFFSDFLHEVKGQ